MSIQHLRIAIAGPIAFDSLRSSLGIRLNGAPSGGRETPINPLAVELLRRGHELHLVTLDPAVPDPVEIREQNLSLYVLPRRNRARDLALTFFSQEVSQLVGIFKSIDVDLVHAHWTYEYAEAAIRTSRPHVVTMHDSPLQILRYYRDPYRLFRLLMALRTVPRIRNLAVVSDYLRSHARLHGYLGPLSIVPNGIDIPDTPLRCRMPDRVRIVTVGDTGRGKNVLASINAFEHIRRAIPDAELHLFGPGLDASFVGHSLGVHGWGSVPHEQLMTFLEEQATMLVHPSRQESFGVILVEAMARGVPCIASTGSGGPPEVLGSELSELLVDFKDPARVAATLLRLVGSAGLYQRTRVLALSRARRLFSQIAMADRYEKLYEVALRGFSP